MTGFSETLTGWYRAHKRNLPWRKIRNPYPIWLSEIILQQTRVEQGTPYWERFIEVFPTVSDLACAEEERVLRLWQGLGYYSRARNLHATAKIIHEDFNGYFPSDYEGLLKLKGIGPYTAAAIASICFGERRPVVDGNVFRFASRYFGIKEDISSSGARIFFEQLLLEHVPISEPGNFNQAMMEFGARVCTPSPQCDLCVFQLDCYAFYHQKQNSLPIKTKKVKVKKRQIHYIVIENGERLYMRQRNDKDVWKGLYDFYALEGAFNEEEIFKALESEFGIGQFIISDVSSEVKHILSHQKILAVFYRVEILAALENAICDKLGINPFSRTEILNLPKPKLIVNYLAQLGIK